MFIIVLLYTAQKLGAQTLTPTPDAFKLRMIGTLSTFPHQLNTQSSG